MIVWFYIVKITVHVVFMRTQIYKDLIHLGVPFPQMEKGGLSASIFSKQKRICAAIPNVTLSAERGECLLKIIPPA